MLELDKDSNERKEKRIREIIDVILDKKYVITPEDVNQQAIANEK